MTLVSSKKRSVIMVTPQCEVGPTSEVSQEDGQHVGARDQLLEVSSERRTMVLLI